MNGGIRSHLNHQIVKVVTRWLPVIVTWQMLAGLCVPLIAAQPDYAAPITSLIAPCQARHAGRAAGESPHREGRVLAGDGSPGRPEAGQVAARAVAAAGYSNQQAAKLTRAALLRNLDIAGELGCLDAEGMAEMRKGNAPTVRRGPYRGDQLSVDHIIPRAVGPELDNVIANLELMPERLNASKSDRIGGRQVDLARKLAKANLLSQKRLEAVERAGGGDL